MHNPNIPAALAEAFKDRLTVTGPELCKLIPFDRDTLRRHVDAGHIEYVKLGAGKVAPRKAFTLSAVMKFLEGQSYVAIPPSSSPRPRRSNAAPSGEEYDFRQIRARLISERQQQAGTAPASSSEGGGFLANRARRVAERERQKAAGRRATR